MLGFWQRGGDGKLSGAQENITGEAQHGVRDIPVVVTVWPQELESRTRIRRELVTISAATLIKRVCHVDRVLEPGKRRLTGQVR